MSFSKHFQFFIKELNKNKSNISKVFFTIFISLLILSSVTILKNSIEDEIKNNSRVLLGGDLELSTKNEALNLRFLNKLKESFFISEIVEFTSIIKTKNEENQTTRIKVIDNFYPLVGKVVVEPANSLEILKTMPNTILIDETTQKNLDLKLGERIKIQNTTFEVIGITKRLPDIGGFFIFGDQALIHKSSLEDLKINNLGTFLRFKYKLTKKDSKKKLPSIISNYKNLEIKYPEDISQNVKKAIENFIYFLSIISASAILISGIGLKNSLFSFLSKNQLKIAIFKSLGFSSQNIKVLYYAQALVILVLCSCCAYICSLVIISFIDHRFLNLLNIELKVQFKIVEYLIILFFSILIFMIFSKPVLDSIDQVKVADLFRNSSTHLNLNYNRRSILQISTFVLIFIFFFCFLNVKPKQTALFFFFFYSYKFVLFLFV